MIELKNLKLNSKIFLAGSTGLVGSAVLRQFKQLGFNQLLTPTRQQLNLTCQPSVDEYFNNNDIEYVIMCAGLVGGIKANSDYPADFFYNNMIMASHLIHAAFHSNVKKLLYLGSSCIYPKNTQQPIKENDLMTGSLEVTNQAYAIAKLSGIEYCRAIFVQHNKPFISAMPTSLYGPGDNFDLENSHVIAALIKKFHQAKLNNQSHVEIWGSGTPLRDFLFVDDLAHALVLVLDQYDDGNSVINIGSGMEISIKQLALLIKKVVGFEGELKFDCSKPDGTHRKILDNSKINQLKFTPQVKLQDGIKATYQWALRSNLL